jgi:serine/threonine-protein kinase
MESGGREAPPSSDGPSSAGSDRDAQPKPTGLDQLVEEGLAPDFKILRQLGHSGLGIVYLARETALKRLVAIKVLSPMFAGSREAAARFKREGQFAARIVHPNVVPIHRVDSLEQGIPYLVMEYIDGRSLAQRLKAEGPLEAGEVRQILAQVAGALSAAHGKGVVHRDVKPSNVLCEEGTGRVLLTDFGIAVVRDNPEETAPRLTPIGQLLGDLAYMSPERLAGEEATGESDVYSLGVLAYQLLTGAGPYGDLSIAELTTAHLKGNPLSIAELRDDVEPDLAQLLQRCLAKTPAHRPRASDLLRLLSRAAPVRAAAPQPEPGGREERAAEPALPPSATAPSGMAPIAPSIVSPIRAPDGVIQLRILGTVELLAEDGRSLLSLLTQPKRVALLSYLAARVGEFKRRDSIIGIFWPDVDQERGRHALRQAIYGLRRSLGPKVIESRGSEEVGLSRDKIWCDASAFAEALDAGNSAEALELYNGELLPGFYLSDGSDFERWLDVSRDELRRRAAKSAWALVDELVGAGNETGAAYWARRAVGLSPYDEQALCRLVELLSRCGDRAGALHAYEIFAQRLKDELDSEPSPATRDLIQRVQSGVE